MISTHEMPDDPDLDDVPPELAAVAADPHQEGSGLTTVVIAPGLFGHARRLRVGWVDPDPEAEQ